MIVIDAPVLLLMVNPDAPPPNDPATGAPLARAKDRIELFIASIQKARETIVIPTPALAEALVRADDAAPAILDRFNRSAFFKVAEFDQRAAVEHAAMTRDAVRAGDKFDGSTAPWQKVKFDRQIIAIARVHQAQRIYSDDKDLGNLAVRLGMAVTKTWDLPLPEDPPLDLFSTLRDESEPQT